jgi:hypothetical protein
MSMQREAGRVRIDISEDEYELLMWALGVATFNDGPDWRLVELANAINEGNPKWTPIARPDALLSEPPLAWSEQWRRA